MAQIEEARRVVGELVEQSRTVTEHTAVYDLEPEHTAERPLLRRIKAPTRVHPFFDQLMRSDAILDCLEPLIGPDIRFQGDKLNMKTAAIGSPVEWHQDVAFYPHTNDDLLAVGVALDDCTLENGCLLVIPGSHRGPTLDHHQDGYFVGAISPSREAVDPHAGGPGRGAGRRHFHPPRGRAARVGAPNTSSRPRRLLLYQYAAADAWPLSGTPDYAAFDGMMVRGEPTREYRQLPHTAVRIPSPQPPRVGSIFELQTQLKETVFADRK